LGSLVLFFALRGLFFIGSTCRSNDVTRKGAGGRLQLPVSRFTVPILSPYTSVVSSATVNALVLLMDFIEVENESAVLSTRSFLLLVIAPVLVSFGVALVYVCKRYPGLFAALLGGK
jgi:hypothetical protein